MFNARENRICAFCRHWYDPLNTAIKPKAGVFWLVDETVKKRCIKTVSTQKQSTARCMEFESKM